VSQVESSEGDSAGTDQASGEQIMSAVQLQRRLDELAPLARGETLLDALAIAIAVEESFGITLADSDITPEFLCSPSALTSTILRCVGGN
jgi:hypothetical protein